mgnify:CR=1 FL=1
MVSVGRVLRSHDKWGEVKVRLLEPGLVNLAKVETVQLGRGGIVEEFRVQSARPRGKDFVLKLAGVDSLSQADRLVGRDVLVAESSLAGLEAGRFYVFDLVGCRVRTMAGDEIGRVTDVVLQGERALLVVDRGGREALVPFHESFCKEVSLPAREIRVELPEGLLDLNES